ncbi:MAG: hypothetical protein LIO56_00095 [Lachnospiraceae bacterium]|nr:hypothetical protein [Lachnospiraceae bacterium]
MTERENALIAYRHQKPEWIPLTYDAVQEVGFVCGNECGLGSPDLKDVFGVQWIIKKDPTPDPHCPVMLEEIEDWEDVIKFPHPREWDWDKIRETELAEYDPNRVLVWFCEQGMFDRMTTFGGFENALCWLLEDPEECKRLASKIADYKIELIECVGEYIKPDVFMYTDDVATAKGLFMSPDTWREVFKEDHARIIAAIKENGMIAEQHTCGKCDDIMDDYMENGIECFFPAQVVNDLKGIQKKYGDRLTIRGGYDSQGPAGDIEAPDDVIQAEARRMIDDYGEEGSFIAMPMIMDGTLNWTVYEPSHRQKVFYDEFYRYAKEKGLAQA